jgi:HEAT repeat protein
MLTSRRPVDRQAVLRALGGSLARLRKEERLPESSAESALEALSRAAHGRDERLAAAAVDALARWRDPAAVPVIGRLLRTPSVRRRAGAVLALGAFPGDEVRAALRMSLRQAPVPVLSAAAISLGDVGNAGDAMPLLKAASQHHWPVPAAAAYALARLARREAIRRRSVQRGLCELGRSREPYVRANVAVALAAMGAAPCEGGPHPLRWLTSRRAAPVVRAAAARWAFSAAAAGKLPEREVRGALAACARRESEPRIVEACEIPRMPPLDDLVDVYAFSADGRTLLSHRPVALLLADGSVFVGLADANGHVRIHGAPRGELLLEDPGLIPLEPPLVNRF